MSQGGISSVGFRRGVCTQRLLKAAVWIGVMARATPVRESRWLANFKTYTSPLVARGGLAWWHGKKRDGD